MTTTYPDWRTGPDPMHCTSCGTSEGACDNKRTFANRSCCDVCEHEPKAAR
jgi:hypothetical protein